MGKANQLNAEIGNPVKTHGRLFFSLKQRVRKNPIAINVGKVEFK